MAHETESETSNTAEMKIRLPAILRRQIEGAAADNHRKMNAEIVLRLERTFREDIERTGEALNAIQASSTIRLEKQMVKDRADLEQQIDDLAAAVTAIKRQLKAKPSR